MLRARYNASVRVDENDGLADGDTAAKIDCRYIYKPIYTTIVTQAITAIVSN